MRLLPRRAPPSQATGDPRRAGVYRALLTTYLAPQRRQVGLLGVALCAEIGLLILNPLILRGFIDAVSTQGAHTHLAPLAAAFLGVAILGQLLSVAATYLGERIGWSATNALRADLTLHLLRLDPGFHKRHTPGELIERVDGDITALANFFSRFVIEILGSLLLLLGVLVVLWAVEWRAGLALTLFAALTLAVMAALRAFAVPQWTRARQAGADLYGFLEEHLAGTADIRACAAQPYVLRRLTWYLRERLRIGRRARILGSTAWSASMVLFALGNAVAFALAVYLRRDGMSLGSVFLIYYYAQLLWQPLDRIAHQIDDFQQAGAGAVRVGQLLGLRSALTDDGRAALPSGALAVRFERVDFGYDDDAPVLRDINFQIAPGQVLGLVGRTGSGKTTIARLLLRIHDPRAGAVSLGGLDTRTIPLADLRRHIGMVTQDVQLFRATVRENLTIFDPTIDDARLHGALAALGLDAWCRALPRGLDTLLAAGGGGLSAGEAQLLAFTRVFLRDPGLVILDEASSRLDPATERLIEGAVTRLLAGRTGLIIAHRLDTIRRADQILLLEEGRIVEHGPRDALAADSRSRFAALLRAGQVEAPV